MHALSVMATYASRDMLSFAPRLPVDLMPWRVKEAGKRSEG
jgi:hypothetical protein